MFIRGGVDYHSYHIKSHSQPEQTEASFNVSLTDDNIFESNEDFMITIDPSSLPLRFCIYPSRGSYFRRRKIRVWNDQ